MNKDLQVDERIKYFGYHLSKSHDNITGEEGGIMSHVKL